jgi:Flp pilus assembly protein TadG
MKAAMLSDRRGDIKFGKESMPYKSTRHRRAASAVEFAIVLPLVMMLIFGGIELGRAVMVQHVLDEVARGASRMYAVTTELTQSDVDAYIATAMSEADLAAYTVTYNPLSANTVAHLDPMQVTVSVNYNDVAILPAPWFMGGKQLAGTCIMPADTGALPQATDPEPPPKKKKKKK